MRRVTEHRVRFGHSPLPVESVATPVPRIAQLLALAIRFERLLRAGEIAQSEIARRYGVSRARVSQVLNLVNLSPGIQEEMLLGRRTSMERSIRRAAQILDWHEQGDLLNRLVS